MSLDIYHQQDELIIMKRLCKRDCKTSNADLLVIAHKLKMVGDI